MFLLGHPETIGKAGGNRSPEEKHTTFPSLGVREGPGARSCLRSGAQLPSVQGCRPVGVRVWPFPCPRAVAGSSLVLAINPVNGSWSPETCSALFFFPPARREPGTPDGPWGQQASQREQQSVPSRHTGLSPQGRTDPLQMRVEVHAKLSTVKEPAMTGTTTGQVFLARHAYTRLHWSHCLRSTIFPPWR